jgi:hypothetical protein
VIGDTTIPGTRLSGYMDIERNSESETSCMGKHEIGYQEISSWLGKSKFQVRVLLRYTIIFGTHIMQHCVPPDFSFNHDSDLQHTI